MKHLSIFLLLCLAAINTNGQPYLVKDIIKQDVPMLPAHFSIINNSLFFGGHFYSNGRELWTLDTFGVRRLTDINPGWESGLSAVSADKLCIVDSNIYFVGMYPGKGWELCTWHLRTGARIIKDITPGVGGSISNSIYEFYGKIYFQGTQPGVGAAEAWVYDPAQGIISVLNGYNQLGLRHTGAFFGGHNGKIYFMARHNGYKQNRRFICVYDPGQKTTDTLHSTFDFKYASTFTSYGSTLYFIAETEDYGNELACIKNDKVVLVKDLNPGIDNGVQLPTMLQYNRDQLGKYKGSLYFSGNDGKTGYQLYRYDTSTKQVTLLHNIFPDSNAGPGNFCIFNDTLLFTATDSAHGNEIWAYDSLSAPYIIYDVIPGEKGSRPISLTVFNKNLYFSADTVKGSSSIYGMYQLYPTQIPAWYPPTRTALTAKDNISNITVYPNPATNTLHIQLPGKAYNHVSITLFDLHGRKVFSLPSASLPGGEHYAIDISTFKPGLYYYSINVRNNKHIYTGTFSKL